MCIDDFGRAGPATVRLADQVLAPAGIVPLIADLPAGVEATIRESKDRRLLFILNTLGEADVPNIPKGTDLGDAQVKAGRMRLPRLWLQHHRTRLGCLGATDRNRGRHDGVGSECLVRDGVSRFSTAALGH